MNKLNGYIGNIYMAVIRRTQKHKAREEDLQLKSPAKEQSDDLRVRRKSRNRKKVGKQAQPSPSGLSLFDT
jgi:hypothetical protein